MRGSWPLHHAAVLGMLSTGIIIVCTAKPESGKGLSIALKQEGVSVTLQCKGGSDNFTWWKDGHHLSSGKKLSLGSAMDDPRGFYVCEDKNQKMNASLQVFFRMCQNCVYLNFSTILGVMVASLVATVFLAVAVYYVAMEEPSRRPQVASDKQNLLANEQLYQPLGDRSNGQYSHIGVAKTRHR